MFYVATVVLCTWIYRWQRRRSLVYSMPGTPGKCLNCAPKRACGVGTLCALHCCLKSLEAFAIARLLFVLSTHSPKATPRAFACAGDASSSLACPSSFISLPPCCCQGNVCLRADTAYIQPSQLPSGSNPNVSIDTNTRTHIPNTYTTPM